jgi:hypothetical protein
MNIELFSALINLPRNALQTDNVVCVLTLNTALLCAGCSVLTAIFPLRPTPFQNTDHGLAKSLVPASHAAATVVFSSSLKTQCSLSVDIVTRLTCLNAPRRSPAIISPTEPLKQPQPCLRTISSLSVGRANNPPGPGVLLAHASPENPALSSKIVIIVTRPAPHIISLQPALLHACHPVARPQTIISKKFRPSVYRNTCTRSGGLLVSTIRVRAIPLVRCPITHLMSAPSKISRSQPRLFPPSFTKHGNSRHWGSAFCFSRAGSIANHHLICESAMRKPVAHEQIVPGSWRAPLSHVRERRRGGRCDLLEVTEILRRMALLIVAQGCGTAPALAFAVEASATQ